MAKHRRGRSTSSAPRAPTAARDPLPLSLADVYLLTTDSDGHEAVAGLTVVVDHDGLTVITPHGTIATVLTWPELIVLRTAGRTRAPGGEDAVILEATSSLRTHRFLVPSADGAAFEATIAQITGVVPPGPAPRTARRG